jgi:transposase InsO family protein
MMRYPSMRGAIIHSDRGSQYTSYEYRTIINEYGIIQSMNSGRVLCLGIADNKKNCIIINNFNY